MKVYVYTTPTFDVLKQEVYKDALMATGSGPVLDSLPWGVDLQACVDFLTSYDKKNQVGTFTASDGTTKTICITKQLVADALGLRVATWKPMTWQSIAKWVSSQ